MAIWTPRQMQRVMGLRVDMQVTLEALLFGVHTRDTVRARLADSMRGSARTLAVEIDERDVQVTEAAPEKEWLPRTFRAHWMPRTRVVELLGGPEDGEQYNVGPRLWQPLFVAGAYGASFEPLETLADYPAMAVVTRHTYHLETWNEATRHWVFRYGGEA